MALADHPLRFPVVEVQQTVYQDLVHVIDPFVTEPKRGRSTYFRLYGITSASPAQDTPTATPSCVSFGRWWQERAPLSPRP